MDKYAWYKLLAIIVVGAFILQGFATGVLSGGGQQTQEQEQEGASFTGNAFANVTLVRYEPYLIVEGGGTEAEEVKQGLIDEGIATYAVPSQGKLVVSLKTSKSVVSAASEFEKANASAIATAVIRTPEDVRVQGEGIVTTAKGTSFNLQIRPILEQGSVHEASFLARVENGYVTGIGDFSIIPEFVENAVVFAGIVSEKKTGYSVEIAWQNRTAARQIVKEQGAEYQEKSYIAILENATLEQLNAAALQGQSYITGTRQGIISVKNDFSDIELAGGQLFALGLFPTFPPSIATFENQSTNETALSLNEKLGEQGISAEIASSSIVVVKLPETIEANGKEYYTGEEEFEVKAPSEMNATNVTLVLDFEAIGSQIVRIAEVWEGDTQS